MSWLTKDLTLDLLAIAIHGMNKAFERISAEPGEWPEEQLLPATTRKPEPTPEQTELKPQPEQTETAPAMEETPNHRPEAQALLRDINLAEGHTWITGTLFPHFGVQTLTDIPADKLPELIAMAKEHGKQTA